MTQQQTPSARSRKNSRTMFGSTRKLPSGHWQARYLDDKGVRRCAPRTFPTKREADDWLATARADLLRGTYRAPDLGAIPLNDYLADWLATRTDLAPRTRELYRYHAKTWIGRQLQSPARANRSVNLGDMHVRSITVANVREWYAAASNTQRINADHRQVARSETDRAIGHPARVWALSHGHAVASTGRLSPAVLDAWRAAGSPLARVTGRSQASRSSSQADIAYRVLRTVLGAAVRDGLIVANPCQLLGAGHSRPRERRPATPEQVREIAAAMPARYAVAVDVAAWSGLRAGELFALARRHVDSETGTVRVERSVIELRGKKPTFGPPKTDSSRRVVHLPPLVMSLLLEHLNEYTPADADALVFSRADGSILPAYARTAMFGRARRRAGLPDLRWHDLRHTGATLAAHAGASIREIQARLGHSTVQAAMLYQHATEQRDRELALRLDALARPDNNISVLRQQTAV
jgi:integrase